MIVKAQIQRESYGFGTFTATRVAEIQDRTKKVEWWWISGESNPTDFTTQATNPKNLQTDGIWQTGPEILRRQGNEWPITQECTVGSSSLPDVIELIHHAKQEFPVRKNCKLDDINPLQYNELNKLIRVTAIILGIAKKKIVSI